MELRLTRDAGEFAAAATAFLESAVEHNQLATTLIRARRGFYGEHAPLYAYGSEGDEVRFAALRTPPWPLLIATPPAGFDHRELLARWLSEDPELPGVIGPAAITAALARAWESATGAAARISMASALHALEHVLSPARPAPGLLRPPAAAERDLLVAWEDAFAVEVGLDHAPPAGPTVDARLAEDGVLLWDDDGPVTMLGISPRVAGTVRIGPVYTPPGRRRHGYATSAVAAACERSMAAGAQRMTLFTDLSNPTSNRIYAEVGFRRIADWSEWAFEPLRGSSACR